MIQIFRRQFLAGSAAMIPGLINVRERGAAGDGLRLDTKVIQEAVDACAAEGGGTVYFPPARYLSGTIRLKDNVTLHLERGAVLLGSTDLADYPSIVPAFRSFTDTYTERSLIYAENARNLAIEGRGVIVGQGSKFKYGAPYKLRPFLLRFVSCENVSTSGISLSDAAMWAQHYLDCDGVRVSGITVHSRGNNKTDGLNIDSCRRVRVSDCDISSKDDAIVLKSTSARPCKDIVIANCVLSTECSCLKLGTESNGGFENIAISNCTLYDARFAGISLQSADGGTLDQVSVSNVVMRNIGCPIYMRLNDRARPFQEGMAKPGIGKLRNVIISNVQASGANRTGCSITGLPGHPAENITLDNIRLGFVGGGTRENAERRLPEDPGPYHKHPEQFFLSGPLPAYAFYCRHARNVTFSNVEVSVATPDQRPALVTEDVENLTLAGSTNLR